MLECTRCSLSYQRTVMGFPWAETNPDSRHSNRLYTSIENFKCEMRSIFDRATILVSPVVDIFVQELMDQITVRAVDFNTIEACNLNGLLSSLRI